MPTRGVTRFLLLVLAAACGGASPPRAGAVEPPASEPERDGLPRIPAERDAGRMEVGKDGGAPPDASAPESSAAQVPWPSPPQGVPSAELLSRRYGAAKRHCFVVQAYGSHAYRGVAETDSSRYVKWSLASVDPRFGLPLVELVGTPGRLRLLGRGSELTPEAFVPALAFVHPPALKRLEVRGPRQDPAYGRADIWTYEADTTMPSTNRPVRIYFRQEPDTLRVIAFSYIFGSSLSFAGYHVTFVEEATLGPGRPCPFKPPEQPAKPPGGASG